MQFVKNHFVGSLLLIEFVNDLLQHLACCCLAVFSFASFSFIIWTHVFPAIAFSFGFAVTL